MATRRGTLLVLVAVAALMASSSAQIPTLTATAEFPYANTVNSDILLVGDDVYTLGNWVNVTFSQSTNEYGFSPYDGLLIKYNRNLTEQWNRTYDFGVNEYLARIASGDNHLFMVGSSANGTGLEDYKGLLLKVDLDGNVLWRKYVQGIEGTLVADLAFRSGHIYLTGSTNNTKEYYLAKFDAATGAIVSSCSFSTGGSWHMATGIEIDTEGRIFLTGVNVTVPFTAGLATAKTVIMRVQEGCSVLWREESGTVSRGRFAEDLAATASGNLTIAGTIGETQPDLISNKWMFANSYAANGTLRWNVTYDEEDLLSEYSGHGVAVDGNGNSYIAGTKGSEYHFYNITGDYLNEITGLKSVVIAHNLLPARWTLWKYSANGSLEWAMAVVYDGSDSHARDIVTSADGALVFATGDKLKPWTTLSPSMHVRAFTTKHIAGGS